LGGNVQFESRQKQQIFLYLQNVQTSSVVPSAPYSTGTEGSSPDGEVDGA